MSSHWELASTMFSFSFDVGDSAVAVVGVDNVAVCVKTKKVCSRWCTSAHECLPLKKIA
jgi:hypothetical protein